MVILACKCLNVTVNISNSDVDLTAAARPFRTDPGPHTEPSVQDFLKEAVGPLTDISSLRFETKHDELTTSRRFQLTPSQVWNLVSCVICEHSVYACNSAARKPVPAAEEEPQRMQHNDFAVLLNGKLLTTLEEINALKMDERYSKIYKVIVRQPSSLSTASLAATTPPKGDASHADAAAPMTVEWLNNNNSEPRLKNLTSLLNERLRRETEAMEERIRQFTEDQFMSLRLFRQAAEQECLYLAQKLKNSPLQPPTELFPEGGDKKLISISIVGGNLLETPPLTPDSGTMTTNNSPPRLLHSARSLAPLIATNNNSNNRFSLGVRKRSSDAGQLHQEAGGPGGPEDEDDFFGADDFFPDQTGGQTLQLPMSDCEDEDDDALGLPNVTGRHIPGRGGDYASASAMMLAKSLPIPTPAMPSGGDRVALDEESEALEGNVDIAASIKALAKSVHGQDAIWDLPPRLRTKI